MNMRICAQGLIALRDARDKRFEMHVVLALIFLHILQACEIIEVTEIVHAKVSEQYERCCCCRVPFRIRLCNYISTEWKVVGTYTVQGLPLLQYIAKKYCLDETSNRLQREDSAQLKCRRKKCLVYDSFKTHTDAASSDEMLEQKKVHLLLRIRKTGVTQLNRLIW